MLLFFITAILGALKNYTKYKDFQPLLFIRTPLMLLALRALAPGVHLGWLMIVERWILLFYKTVQAWINDDYHSKRVKYQKKYGIKYD